MLLYHTGFEQIPHPDLHRGRKNADFGQGFYLTPEQSFAERWAKAQKGRETYVNVYALNGVDIAVPAGTEIKSPWDGTVLQTYSNDAGGRQMIVTHTNGYRTGYAHLSAFRARAGQQVKAGDTICLSGNTGRSTGPHLHFTLTDPHGAKIDPETIFNFKA